MIWPVCQSRVTKLFPREINVLIALRKWNRAPTPQTTYWKPWLTYSYTLQSSVLFNKQAVRITVKNGNVISMMQQRKTIKQDQTITMEQWFSIIRQAIDSKALRFDVKYDPKYGYPIFILIQQKPNTPIITYAITDFQLQ